MRDLWCRVPRSHSHWCYSVWWWVTPPDRLHTLQNPLREGSQVNIRCNKEKNKDSTLWKKKLANQKRDLLTCAGAADDAVVYNGTAVDCDLQTVMSVVMLSRFIIRIKLQHTSRTMMSCITSHLEFSITNRANLPLWSCSLRTRPPSPPWTQTSSL